MYSSSDRAVQLSTYWYMYGRTCTYIRALAEPDANLKSAAASAAPVLPLHVALRHSRAGPSAKDSTRGSASKIRTAAAADKGASGAHAGYHPFRGGREYSNRLVLRNPPSQLLGAGATTSHRSIAGEERQKGTSPSSSFCVPLCSHVSNCVTRAAYHAHRISFG
eukprot:SAG31_NODE_503_length_14804_cov_32.491670_13_plen_164_part_00